MTTTIVISADVLVMGAAFGDQAQAAFPSGLRAGVQLLLVVTTTERDCDFQKAVSIVGATVDRGDVTRVSQLLDGGVTGCGCFIDCVQVFISDGVQGIFVQGHMHLQRGIRLPDIR